MNNIINGNLGYKGADAYEIAVQNGYDGTLEQWLNSLDLAISDTISSSSTNSTASGSKAVYDAISNIYNYISGLTSVINLETTDFSNNIAEISYPTGFTRDNSIVIGYMRKVGTSYETNVTFLRKSDIDDAEATDPNININDGIIFYENKIRVIRKNSANDGCKIVLLKIA